MGWTKRINLAGLAAAGFAAACAGGDVKAPEPPNFSSIYSAKDAPSAGYSLYAADIKFVDSYAPPLRAPNIEHNYAVAPADIARTWAKTRLRAAGADGVVTLTVLDGSVVETSVDAAQPGGPLGVVKDRPDREYVATLRIALDYQGRFENTRAETTVTGKVVINRNDTVFDAQERYYATMTAMAKRLDQEMARLMTRSFSGLTLTQGSGDAGVKIEGDCPDPVVIDISAGGAFRVGSQPVAVAELTGVLDEIAARCPVVDALILADEAAPGRTKIEAMGAARAAGLRPVLETRAGS